MNASDMGSGIFILNRKTWNDKINLQIDYKEKDLQYCFFFLLFVFLNKLFLLKEILFTCFWVHFSEISWPDHSQSIFLHLPISFIFTLFLYFSSFIQTTNTVTMLLILPIAEQCFVFLFSFLLFFGFSPKSLYRSYASLDP